MDKFLVELRIAKAVLPMSFAPTADHAGEDLQAFRTLRFESGKNERMRAMMGVHV